MKNFRFPTLFLLLLLVAGCKSAATQNFSFERLSFHSGMCFGFCPSYHIEIQSDKSARLVGDSLSFRGKQPNASQQRIGRFTATLPDSTYNKMVRQLAEIGLDTLKFDGPMCCDGSVKTLIVYYNGKRKYLKAMFPPDHAHDLIQTLMGVYSKTNWKPTREFFEIEQDSAPKIKR